jgi:hypothetical protein
MMLDYKSISTQDLRQIPTSAAAELISRRDTTGKGDSIAEVSQFPDHLPSAAVVSVVCDEVSGASRSHCLTSFRLPLLCRSMCVRG